MDVKKLHKRYKALAAEKSNYSSLFESIASFTQPNRNDFTSEKTKGRENREQIFDTTAEESLANLSAALQSLLFNPAHTWFELDVLSTEVSDDIKEWLDEATKIMMALFSSSTSRFNTSSGELLSEVANLGSGVLFEDEEDMEIRVFNIPLSEVVLAENSKGTVDTMFRRFDRTAAQLVEKYGEGKVNEKIRRAYSEAPDTKFKVIHAIYPREKSEYDPDSVNPKKFKFASVYYLENDCTVLSESGYVEQPFQAPRWWKNTGETYGVGQGSIAIPLVRSLNEMQRSLLIASEKQADPTLLLPDDGFLGPFSSEGGSINTYRANTSMKDRVITLDSRADLGALFNIIQNYQDNVRRLYLNDKLQMVGGPQMTATEVIATQEEKMRLLGPVVGRFETELLEPLIQRVFGLLLRRGELPEVPQEMQGQRIKVKYISPITRAQKQTEAQAFSQAVNYLSPLAPIAPEMLQNFDFDAVARDTQTLFGYPQKYLKNDKQINAERKQQAQVAQQQQQMMEAQQQAELAKKGQEVRVEESKVE